MVLQEKNIFEGVFLGGVWKEMELAEVAILAFFVALISHGVAGRSISREEDLELEKQLNLLNKPAIKSIEMENGVIFDCVDINKQPGLDHPNLKNHKVQLRPSSIPEGILRYHGNHKTSFEVGLKDGGCPQGTVPIRRLQKGDLIRAKSFASEDVAAHVATTKTIGDNDAYYGAQSAIGVNNPRVLDQRSSSAFMVLSNSDPADFNFIRVGWTVNQGIYGDNKTRFITSWGSGNLGCYDKLCPGFILISYEVNLGFTLHPVSTYKGEQFEFKASVFQDQGSGNWWLIIGSRNQVVGYWPKAIFNFKSLDHASIISWGGFVHGPPNEPNKPEMGSGHFPDEGFKGSCFFDQIQYIKDHGKFVDPDESKLTTYADKPNCYKVGGKTDEVDGPGYHFFFGGPGGNCE